MKKLDGCVVPNAHNTVFGSKRSAICATVELSYNVFFKLNDLHMSIPATIHEKGAGMPCRYTVPVHRTGAYRQKKSTGIVADMVANIIAALLMYQ